MPVLKPLYLRIGLMAMIPISLIAIAALAAVPAGAFPIGENHDGPAFEYSGGAGVGCEEDKSDPVGIVFRGKAGVLNTREEIADRTGWDNTDTGLTIFGHRFNSDKQELKVRQSIGEYTCEENDMAIAEAGGANSRFHVRLWRAHSKNGNVVTVGTPHHEDFVIYDAIDNHCELIPEELEIGNHAVDKGGVNQPGTPNSGFDRARHELYKDFDDAGYEVSSEQWGNTVEFKQCDDDYAGSNGLGVIVTLANAVHAHSSSASQIQKFAARLNGELITEEPQTEYFWGFGKQHAQGVGNYEHTTAPKTVSGTQQITTGEPISSLEASTTYYFRMFARNQEGFVQEGAELDFTTCGTSLNESLGASNPRALASCRGTIDVFHRSPAGEIGHDWYDTGGLGWLSGNLPGTAASDIDAIAQENGTIDIFFRTPSGELGHDWYDVGGSGWHSGNLPGQVASAPDAVVQPNGTIDVFYRTPSGQLGHDWFDVGGSGWHDGILPGSVASNPRALVQTNGTVDVFYRTPSGELGHNWFDTGGLGWLSGNLPGPVAPGAEPQPLLQANGTVDVFFTTPSGELGHDWYDVGGSGWHSGNLPGPIAPGAEPQPAIQPNGTVDVFFRTPSKELGHDWFDIGGSGWLSGNLPGPVESEPAVAAQPNGTIDVFFRTTNGELGHDWYDTGGSGWHSGNLPGPVSTAPETTSQYNGTVDVFYRAPWGGLGHDWFDTGGIGWQSGELPGAVASEKPEVTTGSVTAITTGSATLNASVNPEGMATTYQFEYGTTTSYGSKAPASAQSVGDGAIDAAVSQPLTGLTQGTTYHYRLVATNGEGTTYGPDSTFKTNSPGPAPTETSLALGQVLNGQPGYVTVSGSVKAGASLAGEKVTIQYEKETSPGVYTPITSVEQSLGAAGEYSYGNLAVSQGNWRAIAKFKGGATFASSSSSYLPFHVGLGYQLVFEHSFKCVDVLNGSVANGAILQQWDCLDPSTHLNQVFQLVPVWGPWYQIRNIGSGRCVDVSAGSTANGAWLQQWDCMAVGHQMFQMVPTVGWPALQAAHDVKCIDVNSSSTVSGVYLQQWDCHWGNNQRIGFFPVG